MMRVNSYFFLFFILCFACIAHGSFGQDSRVTGVLVDSESKKPLPFVQVALLIHKIPHHLNPLEIQMKVEGFHFK
ncbi:hypothetical protein V8V91_26070 [Algoriphagus halophilus]|uniref:hypothetical protein n=1 Tax=Algoriphagus halophilus TaxID=226505 RepID=UPI00358DFFF9